MAFLSSAISEDGGSGLGVRHWLSYSLLVWLGFGARGAAFFLGGAELFAFGADAFEQYFVRSSIVKRRKVEQHSEAEDFSVGEEDTVLFQEARESHRCALDVLHDYNRQVRGKLAAKEESTFSSVLY